MDFASLMAAFGGAGGTEQLKQILAGKGAGAGSGGKSGLPGGGGNLGGNILGGTSQMQGDPRLGNGGFQLSGGLVPGILGGMKSMGGMMQPTDAPTLHQAPGDMGPVMPAGESLPFGNRLRSKLRPSLNAVGDWFTGPTE